MADSVAETRGNARAASVAPSAREITWRNMIIATVCLVGATFGVQMITMALGYVLLPMTREFGWTRAEFTLASTFMTWSGALTMPFVGRVMDKVGVRPLTLIGTLVAGLVTLALSRQTASLPILYVLYTLLGATSGVIIGYSKVIASIFRRNRGKMLAVFGIESTLLAAVVPLLTAFLLDRYGWRGLYVTFGAMMLATTPLLFFFLEEPGVQGAADAVIPAINVPRPPVMAGLTVTEMLRTQSFWILMAATFIASVPAAAMIVHMVPFMVQRGFSNKEAGAFYAMANLSGVIGTALAGWLMDKIPTAKIASPFYFVATVGHAMFWFVSPLFGGVAFLFFTSAIAGFAQASTRPMTPYFITRFFGLRAFAEVHGIERTILAVAMGLAVPGFGLLYDATHSYAGMFVIWIASGLACSVLYLFIGPYRYAADVGVTATETALSIEEAGSPAIVVAE